MSVYLIKQQENNKYLKHTTFLEHCQNMKSFIKQCIEVKNIKKLTLLSYEEGALATLLAIS